MCSLALGPFSMPGRSKPLRLRRLDIGEANQPLLSSGSNNMGKEDDEPVGTRTLSAGSTTPVDVPGNYGMTLFERKSVLINREIDDNCMGRYQW